MVTADGPGSTVTRMPGLRCGRHQPVAGIADAGHPGVGDQQDVLAGDELGQQRRRPARFHVVVVGHDPAGQPDAERGGEPAQPPGVLGRDQAGRAESGAEPGRGIGRLADRHGRDRQRAASARAGPVASPAPAYPRGAVAPIRFPQ